MTRLPERDGEPTGLSSTTEPQPSQGGIPNADHPAHKRLLLAAHAIGFAKNALDEEEQNVRKFLEGRSNLHLMLGDALMMMERAMADLFHDDAASCDRSGEADETREASGSAEGESAVPEGQTPNLNSSEPPLNTRDGL